MSDLTLKEIQRERLEILQVVHDFCLANPATGFIPWDDIDIIMPRPDYDRFIRTTT